MTTDTPHRRLAAIMFTDIVGYTALMQRSEAQAVALRRQHRRVFEEQHQLHRGEILQYFGDGTLSVFESGVAAVECAIAIQRGLREATEKVPLRIGLHLGDIVFDGTEIYGDGVNLASRIEGMGLAGAILLSDRLTVELRNHPRIGTQSLGRFELKNIERPVEVFAVVGEGLKIPRRAELRGKQRRARHSLAVLPLVNRSADEATEYFSDGMTEEIINALSRVEGLKVTSRTSSFFFKGKNIPIRQIGRELNVSTILEGSIRLAGSKLRITAQLVDVEEDYQFWSERFDRSVADIFAVQDEISLLIADRLREHLGHFEVGAQLVEAPPVPVEAYRRYLRSRYHLLKMTKPDLERGLALLEDILSQQPDFALAHLAMHLGYALFGTIGLMPAGEAFARGKSFLDRAIALEEDLPECQLHLSYIAFLQDWDFTRTYQHLNRSFELRPTVEYYQSVASVLVAERKAEAARNYIDTALQLDPFSAINHHLQGYIYYTEERYEAALECFARARDLNPAFMASTLYYGQALLLLGRGAEGLRYFQALPTEEGEDLMKLGGTTLAQATLQDYRSARVGIERLEAARAGGVVERAVHLLILCRTALGEVAAALELIEEGIALRLPMMVYLYAEPLLIPLRPHSRFQELMRRVLGERTTAFPAKRGYKKSLVAEADLPHYRQRLEGLMTTEKPYLRPDLTLRDLAQQLDLPPNQLSQVLNRGLDQNFSAYVNAYRLEAFKAKVADPANRHLTLLGLAYDSGFNSKTVFNTFFKKKMGQTPRAYWRSVVGE